MEDCPPLEVLADWKGDVGAERRGGRKKVAPL